MKRHKGSIKYYLQSFNESASKARWVLHYICTPPDRIEVN